MKFCYFTTEVSITAERFSELCKIAGADFKLIHNPSIFNDYIINIPILSKFFGCDDEIFIQKVIEEEPDIVGMSLFSDVQLHRKLNLLKIIKERSPNIKIIVGGPHVSVMEEELLRKYPFIDMAVRRAGEKALVSILKEIPLNEIKGLIYRDDNDVKKNESCLFPDEKLYNIAQRNKVYNERFPYLNKTFLIDSNYGCLFRCSYCYNSLFSKKTIIYRDPVKLIDDIFIAQQNGAQQVCFFDDNFILNKEKAIELLDLYRMRISIPFTCIVHPSLVDEEIIKKMKEAGCIGIEMGVQTMNQKLRRKYLNRYEDNKTVINTMRLAKKYSISLKVDHLFGIPDQTEDDVVNSFLIYKRYNIYHVTTFFLMLYPKILINKILFKKGLIDKKTLSDIENGNIGSQHKQTALKVDANILKLEAIAAVVPRLPYPVLKLILKKRLYRIFPDRFPFWVFRFFIYFLEAIFSKQHVMSRREIYIYYKTMKDSIFYRIKGLFSFHQ